MGKRNKVTNQPILPSIAVELLRLLLNSDLKILDASSLKTFVLSYMSQCHINEMGFCRLARITSLVDFQSFLQSKPMDEDSELVILQQILKVIYHSKHGLSTQSILHLQRESISVPAEMVADTIDSLKKAVASLDILECTTELSYEQIKSSLLMLQDLFHLHYRDVAALLNVSKTSYSDFLYQRYSKYLAQYYIDESHNFSIIIT